MVVVVWPRSSATTTFEADAIGVALNAEKTRIFKITHIVWHDNSGVPPGPSDWSLVAAVLVTPADGPTWLQGARLLTPADQASQLDPPGADLIPPEWHGSALQKLVRGALCAPGF
jgi:hypothetical protein